MRFLLPALRHNLRALLRTPEFTLAAVLTLALGIGATTAVFSVADAVLFRPLPYPLPDRLVIVWDQLVKLGLDQFPTNWQNYFEYRDRNQAFTDLAAFAYAEMNLAPAHGTPPERLEAMPVTANFFSVLGLQPALGRAWNAGETGAAILSHALWQRRYNSDPSVIGQSIELNGAPYRVAGVLPAGYAFTIRNGPPPDVLVPLVPPTSDLRHRGALRLLARLKPGIGLAQARANLASVARGIEDTAHPYTGPHGEDAGYRVALIPLREQLFGNLRIGMLVLLTTVALVLLIACANVASLMVARRVRTQREFAIRHALGASRRHILIELAAEALLLTTAGCAAGLLLARWGIAALPTLSPLPQHTHPTLDLRVFAFALLASIASAAFFGLLPALRGPTDLRTPRSAPLRKSLVAVEVALGVALLIGATLLLRSFHNLHAVDPGFDPRNVLTLRITLPDSTYSQPYRRAAFFSDALGRIQRLPGVESAAFISRLPLSGGGHGGDPFSIQGRPYDSSSAVPQIAIGQASTPDYFRAMHIPLLAGRLITGADAETAPAVAVVNATLARGFFHSDPGALGKKLVIGAPRPGARWLTIAGVVADVRNSSLDTAPIPQIYTPFAQNPQGSMFLVARTTADPLIVARQIATVDPSQPVYDVMTMEQRLDAGLSRDRFQTALVSAFGLAALLLAMIGIYGVLDSTVSSRIPEIGVRMAVGAQPKDILTFVLREGMTPAVIGMAAGALATLPLARFLSSLLFGVRPHDPAAYAVVLAAFACTALAACLLPARKALRVDPVTALRND